MNRPNHLAAKLLVFAYGSNMCSTRLRQRVAQAKALGAAQLGGYELKFNKKGADHSGKANIKATGRSSDIVPGVVFQIKKRDAHVLDAAEPGYRRRMCQVTLQARGVVSVETYMAYDHVLDQAMVPFDWYTHLCVIGALEHGLSRHADVLRSVPTRTDPDLLRRTQMTRLINACMVG